MTFSAVVKSGLPYRRAGYETFFDSFQGTLRSTNSVRAVSSEDMAADDWEVLKPVVLLDQDDVLIAVMEVLKNPKATLEDFVAELKKAQEGKRG